MNGLKSLFKNITWAALFFLPMTSGWGAIIFNDIATLPSFKSVGTVIQTDNNGLWRITRETPGYASYQDREPFYANSENGEILFSFTSSGGSFYAERMVPFTMDRIKLPVNVNLGDIMPSESGRIYKNLKGSYTIGSPTTEDVYIYEHTGATWASFKKTGVILKIELLSGEPLPEPTPECTTGKYDPATNKVSIPCLEVPGADGTVVFKTEWMLHSDTDGVLTLKLHRAEVK